MRHTVFWIASCAIALVCAYLARNRIRLPSSAMSQSPHQDLITALTELYTVLNSLAAIPDNFLHLPDPDTGLHPPHAINAAAAKAAGYNEDAIALMYALPYLDVMVHDFSVQLLPSTYVTTYFGADLDEGDFESQRGLLDEEMMPGSAIRLTWSEGGYGTVFVYDTGTKLMTPWTPLDNPDEVTGYAHIPAASPKEVLGPIVRAYRTLHYLGIPMDGIDHNHEIFSGSGGLPPRDWGEVDARKWRAWYEVWKAVRGLKSIYLECGWNVDEDDQGGFRREEFLEKRRRYLEEVVEPARRREEAGS